MGAHLRQEEDRIATGRVIAIGAAALIIFALGIVWAVAIQRRGMGGLSNLPVTAVSEAGQGEVGMVIQRPFDHVGDDGRTFDDAALARQRLGSYGWADPARKVARIPIDEAMRILAGEGGP